LHAARPAPRRGPLRRRDPLQILIEKDLARELAPRRGDRGGVAALQRLGPLGPRPLALARMQRAEDRVVLDPPGLLAEEGPQLALAGGREPGRDRLEIADLADPPALRRRAREERDQQTGAPCAGSISHRGAWAAPARFMAVQSKCRTTRPIASPNWRSGTIRL